MQDEPYRDVTAPSPQERAARLEQLRAEGKVATLAEVFAADREYLAGLEADAEALAEALERAESEYREAQDARYINTAALREALVVYRARHPKETP